MADYEIPFKNQAAQKFQIAINGTLYGLSFYWIDAPDGGWIMDIYDGAWEPIVEGIPLVTGSDLLAQYGYLAFGFKMYVVSDGAPYIPPTWQSLGQRSHLYVEY
jgi:hypothetical protein